MKNYKYFENVERNAYFTEIPCQFCGSDKFCLDGVFFDRDDIVSICLNCFDKKKVNVEIPDYIKTRVKRNKDIKIKSLEFNPPVPWIQNNDWPVCCDDYMVYVGEWKHEKFVNYDKNKNGIECLKELLDEEISNRVENFDILWNDIGDGTVAFAFKCACCNKIKIICQDY